MTSIATTRPIRATRLARQAPLLPDILSRIEVAPSRSTYELIRGEYDRVAKYFKQDTDEIATFWLQHYVYDYKNEKHCLLLRYLIATLGVKPYLVGILLDEIKDKSLLRQLGIVRCKRDAVTYYRIYVGDEL
jgi:hypothetical protein